MNEKVPATEFTGLGTEAERDWPSSAAVATKAPLDVLAPGTAEHKRVKEYLVERLNKSERKMRNFYGRWRVAEIKAQAYIALDDYEKVFKELNDTGKPAKAVSIVVPYMFSTLSTIVTYMVHTFGGRRPMFQIGSHKRETANRAQNMETVLQYQAEHTRLLRSLFQLFNDGELYGVGVLRTAWKRETGLRTIMRKQARPGFFGAAADFFSPQSIRVREEAVIYEGNEVAPVDPFMFFPDPAVPMVEVNRKGEFVFWRDFTGKHLLKKLEAEGKVKYIDKVPPMPKGGITTDSTDSDVDASARGLLSGGDATPGAAVQMDKSQSTYQIDQGTCWIIPKELGLGDSTKPELWLFSIANKEQIIQAEKLEVDHGRHPVVVVEPYTLGYGFGQPGMGDYLGSVQDTISWFINSHIYNVRTALNNMFVVDPSMVEMQDLKNPEAGKIIRLKRAAYGQDVRTILQQLQVNDVTATHVRDLEVFMRMGDALSAINDNFRATPHNGGRKTASEVRITAEAGASRLAAHAKLYSAQGMVDLTEQMSLNTQQFLSEEFYLRIVGQDGLEAPIDISPDMLVGDFHYPVHDGTLPLDKVALLEVWKEIFMAVSQDPELRQSYSLPKIFEWIAELGGARNIDNFKVDVQMQPTPQVMDQAAAGNVVPIAGGERVRI